MLYTLLDFLRLRASYDRLAWNLRPVMLVHQVLVRCGRDEAAGHLAQAVAERTAPLADEHLRAFRPPVQEVWHAAAQHCRAPGRAVRAAAGDRPALRLVRPAIEEIREARPPAAVKRLEEQIDEFTKQPSGAGFELPGWLEALDQELERSQWPSAEEEDSFDPHVRLAAGLAFAGGSRAAA